MNNIKDNIWVVDHPFAQVELAKIRDKNTGRTEFRKGLVKLGRISGYELMNMLGREEIEIETPLAKCKGIRIADEDNIVLVNVLRAATPFVEGLLKAFPKARLGVISAKRIESKKSKSLEFDIEINYVKVPKLDKKDIVIIADPMLASGSTLLKVIEHIAKDGAGPKKIISLSVLSTEYGILKIREKYPDITFVTASVDPKLSENGYILPGLGDAGDRAFG